MTYVFPPLTLFPYSFTKISYLHNFYVCIVQKYREGAEPNIWGTGQAREHYLTREKTYQLNDLSRSFRTCWNQELTGNFSLKALPEICRNPGVDFRFPQSVE